MPRRPAFTLPERAVVLVILVASATLLLPAMGAARAHSMREQNNTQLRGIQQGMVGFAMGNGDNFPGLDAQDKFVKNGPTTLHSGNRPPSPPTPRKPHK